MLAERHRSRQLGQRLLIHQSRAQAGQVTFGQCGEMLEQQAGNDEIQQSVAEEFQALVMRHAVTAMGQRLLKQRRIAELVTQSAFDRPFRHG